MAHEVQSAGGLLALEPGDVLRFQDVYDNLGPVLQRVSVRNTQEQPLDVVFRASGEALRWMQLRAGAAEHIDWPGAGAYNSVAWARAGGLSPSSLRTMRHFAANLAPLERLALGACAVADVYVEARPALLSAHGDGRVSPSASSPTRATTPESERGVTQLATELGIEAVCGARAESYTLPVQLNACVPRMDMQLVADGTAHAAEAGGQLVLDYGDVVVGQRESRTIRIENSSAIELFTQLQIHTPDGVPAESPISVVDADSGAAVPAVSARAAAPFAPFALAPYASRLLNIELRPHVACADFEQTITLVNLHLQSRPLRVVVRANILGIATGDVLGLNDSSLDFGDCAGGQWTRQVLILKNNADVVLDVVLSADAGVEATFQLADVPARESEPDAGEEVPDAPLADAPLADVAPALRELLTQRGAAAVRVDDDVSSTASQAGSRPPSPGADGGSVPSVASAPAGGPSRVASYSASALAPSAQGGAVRRLHDPMQMLRGGEQQHNQVDNLLLRPGSQWRIVVSHRPPAEPVDESYSAGRLKHATFNVFLDYARATGSARSSGGRERRTVVCHTRTCTPFVSVSPKTVDFGVASVGTRKNSQIAVTNHSDLSTRIAMRFVSKVLSMYMDEVVVPARQTVAMRIDFFPRRVNDSYRKQITVANLLNRSNDQIFEVRSRNVDPQRVSFHSLFYRILTPSGSNFVDFGDVNINSPRVRSFAIENLCRTRLTLELTVAHPEDLVLYVKAGTQGAEAPPRRDARGTELKEHFLEAISTDARPRAAAAPQPPQQPPRARTVNIGAALRRGAKGRTTIPFGRSVTYKDRAALHGLEPLDLASGPPVDALRLRHPRKYQVLRSCCTSAPASRGEHDERSAAGAGAAPAAASEPMSRADSGMGRAHAQSPTPPPHQHPTSASPALTGKRRMTPLVPGANEVQNLSLDDLIVALESQASNLSTFFLRNLEAEEQYVRSEIALHRALDEAISSHKLVPIGVLEVPPRAEMQVVAVYSPSGSTRPHIQGTARKQDSRVFLRLLEFDAARANRPEFAALRGLDVDELPVRDLMVRATVCRSMLELGQPHINFGHMDKGDERQRKIWIQNRSEWALRYCIRKSGSIASGDIRLGLGRYGVVPGFGKRSVDFVFAPSLSGVFNERLLVKNVADPDDDQAVILKASVRKVPNFAVDPPQLDFGTCRGTRVSTAESVLVTNTTPKSRTLHVEADDSMLPGVPVDVYIALSSDSGAQLSRDEEEEVETLLQKLKIASRKGNVDKLAKYHERLSRLGVAAPGEADSGAPEPSAAAGAAHVFLWPPHRRTPAAPATFTLVLPPNTSQKLLLRVALRHVAHVHSVHVGLHITEQRNRDEVRTVAIHAAAEPDDA